MIVSVPMFAVSLGKPCSPTPFASASATYSAMCASSYADTAASTRSRYSSFVTNAPAASASAVAKQATPNAMPEATNETILFMLPSSASFPLLNLTMSG